MNPTVKQVLTKHAGQDIAVHMQQKLNEPLSCDLSERHEQYYRMIYDMLEKGEIDPLSIQSLFNKDIYTSLKPHDHEKVELAAVNLLHLLRRLHTLIQKGYHDTYQMKNLVESIWEIKQRVEGKYGDVFVV